MVQPVLDGVSRFPTVTAVYKAALTTSKKQNFRTSTDLPADWPIWVASVTE